jgi:hypothetical protein
MASLFQTRKHIVKAFRQMSEPYLTASIKLKFNDSYYKPTVFHTEHTVCQTYKTLVKLCLTLLRAHGNIIPIVS